MKYYAAKLSDKGTVAVDDTILVNGVEATAGSRGYEVRKVRRRYGAP